MVLCGVTFLGDLRHGLLRDPGLECQRTRDKSWPRLRQNVGQPESLGPCVAEAASSESPKLPPGWRRDPPRSPLSRSAQPSAALAGHFCYRHPFGLAPNLRGRSVWSAVYHPRVPKCAPAATRAPAMASRQNQSIATAPARSLGVAVGPTSGRNHALRDRPDGRKIRPSFVRPTMAAVSCWSRRA